MRHVGWHHGDSALTGGTLGEAGRPRAPTASPPGALWGLSGSAQPPAWGDHPQAAPAVYGGTGGQHSVASLELGAAAQARLCGGHGALPLVSAGGAADHRRHHARRGDQTDPPASEIFCRSTPSCPGACPPGSLRLVLRLTAPGGSPTRPRACGLVGATALGSGHAPAAPPPLRSAYSAAGDFASGSYSRPPEKFAAVPPSSPSSAGCPSPATRPVRALRRGPVACRLPAGLASRWREACGLTPCWGR
jgi:hypothetical protein